MNDADKSFEAELRSLQPQPPTPALKQQIANSLSRGPQAAGIPAPLSPRGRGAGGQGATRSRRPIVAIGLLTIATAACIAIVILLPPKQNPEHIVEQPPAANAPIQPLVAAAFDDKLPTLWSYRQALRQSPAAAEALLDQHAAQSIVQPSEENPERARVYLFARFPSELHPLPGEL